MTQGELYEKILEGKRGQYTDSIWSVDDEIYFEVIEVADGHLKSILDEAKKEFPAEIHKDSVDGNYELWAKNNDAEYHIEDLASDVADWFKKWFGDANP